MIPLSIRLLFVLTLLFSGSLAVETDYKRIKRQQTATQQDDGYVAPIVNGIAPKQIGDTAQILQNSAVKQCEFR